MSDKIIANVTSANGIPDGEYHLVKTIKLSESDENKYKIRSQFENDFLAAKAGDPEALERLSVSGKMLFQEAPDFIEGK